MYVYIIHIRHMYVCTHQKNTTLICMYTSKKHDAYMYVHIKKTRRLYVCTHHTYIVVRIIGIEFVCIAIWQCIAVCWGDMTHLTHQRRINCRSLLAQPLIYTRDIPHSHMWHYTYMCAHDVILVTTHAAWRIHICTCTCTYMHIYVYIYAHIRVHMCTYTCAHMHIYVCRYVWHCHTYTYIMYINVWR